MMKKKGESELELVKSMSKACFPIPKLTKVSLPRLAKRIDALKTFETKYDVEANSGGASYVCVKSDDLGLSFNVYRNGKVVIWHSLSPKALSYFLDFFYYFEIINCLERV